MLEILVGKYMEKDWEMKKEKNKISKQDKVCVYKDISTKLQIYKNQMKSSRYN